MLCYLFMVLTTLIPETTVLAESNINKKAHAAFNRELQSLKSGRLTLLPYAYKDVDGDNIDELITEPGFGAYYQVIYKYKNGKVKQVCAIGQGPFKKYYSKKKVIYSEKTGHMGGLYDTYFKWSNGTYKVVAFVLRTYSGDYNATPDTVEYYINNKKTSKEKYQSYTKKLIKGDKGKSFSKIKWKKY